MAIDLAKSENIDLVIGTDPDCDRIGVAVRDNNGEYIKPKVDTNFEIVYTVSFLCEEK